MAQLIDIIYWLNKNWSEIETFFCKNLKKIRFFDVGSDCGKVSQTARPGQFAIVVAVGVALSHVVDVDAQLSDRRSQFLLLLILLLLLVIIDLLFYDGRDQSDAGRIGDGAQCEDGRTAQCHGAEQFGPASAAAHDHVDHHIDDDRSPATSSCCYRRLRCGRICSGAIFYSIIYYVIFVWLFILFFLN